MSEKNEGQQWELVCVYLGTLILYDWSQIYYLEILVFIRILVCSRIKTDLVFLFYLVWCHLHIRY